MSEDFSKISIVVCTFNSQKYVAEALESIRAESYPNKEVIIIDGGSTDKTLDICKGFISHSNIYSERDKGISDAMNRGLMKAQGELIFFLHSDDVLIPGALQKANDVFRSSPDLQWIYGGIQGITSTGIYLDTFISGPFSLSKLLQDNYLHHQSIFMRTEFLKSLGGFNINYKVRMDYDLWFRAGFVSIPGSTEIVVSKYRFHPGSTSLKHFMRGAKEGFQIYFKYSSSIKVSLFSHCFHSFIGFIQTLLLSYKARIWRYIPPKYRWRGVFR